MTEENKKQLEGRDVTSYTEIAILNVQTNYTEKPKCASCPKKHPEHVQAT